MDSCEIFNKKEKEKIAYNNYVRVNKWASNIEDFLYKFAKFKKSYLFKFILKNIVIDKHTKILEIGGGTGYLANALAQYSDQVHLIDMNDDEICGLKAAKKIANRLQQNLCIQKANFENIPYDAEYFDIVLAKSCLHHSLDVKAVFQEVKRVLKKNGIFVLVEPCRGKFVSEKCALRYFYKKAGASIDLNEQSLILDEWKFLLRNNDFMLNKLKPTYFFPMKKYNFLLPLVNFLEKVYLIYANLWGQPIGLPHPFTLYPFGFEYFEIIAFCRKL